MMMGDVETKAIQASNRADSNFHATVTRLHTGSGSLFILAALPRVGNAAQNTRYLHCLERILGLEGWARAHDATLVATDDKDARNCEFDQLLPSATVVITSTYFPAYLTSERMQKAQKLRLIINLSEGSSHIDLNAAADKRITVVELKGSSVESVAEDQIMRVLCILRNFTGGYLQVLSADWNVPEATADAYDLQHKTIGTLGGGKVGRCFIKRLRDWSAQELLYHDLERKPSMDMLHCVRFVPDLEHFVSQCDVVVLNIPLTPRTQNMVDAHLLHRMKTGAVLLFCSKCKINTSHGDIVDRDAVVNAVLSGQLKGIGGDAWDEVPPSKSHPWRRLPCHALTPRMAGLTIDAQASYAQATQDVLNRWVAQQPQPPELYLVESGAIKRSRI